MVLLLARFAFLPSLIALPGTLLIRSLTPIMGLGNLLEQ